MDAVNFSVAAKQIMPEYGLSYVRIGILYTAYMVGYGAFFIPGGFLADTIGARTVVGGALLWWSVFTGLTAAAPNLPGLEVLGPFYAFMVVRFLIGMAEGACYPATSRMISNWMTVDERGSAFGLALSGAGIGYAIAPPVVAFLMVKYGWRLPFYAFAGAGIALAVWWYFYATDDPQAHRSIKAEELELIKAGGARPAATERAIPWRAILLDRNVLLLGATGFCFGYGIFTYQSWFYLYLVNVRGFGQVSGGFFSTGPFLSIAALSVGGGIFSDAMVRRYGRTSGRRVGAILGFLLSASCIAVGAGASNDYLAVVLLSLGNGLLYFAASSNSSAIIDIAGPFAGVTFGYAATMLQCGGMIAPTLTPLLANRFGWSFAIYMLAALAIVASLLWLAIRAGETLALPEESVAVAGAQQATSP
jgi:MFS transporter, ACS family, glucarate transporter